jgi:hypothetical protein
VCLPAVASSNTLETVGNMNIKMHILNAQGLCNELLELNKCVYACTEVCSTQHI